MAEFQGHDATVVKQSGKPTGESYRYFKNLDRDRLKLQNGKADKATTLAGYGITDAEKLGEVAGILTIFSNYTLALANKGWIIETAGGTPIAITVPTDASVAFPIKSYFNFTHLGPDTTFVSEGGLVTIRSYNNALTMAGLNAAATIYKRGANDWVLSGNLVA